MRTRLLPVLLVSCLATSCATGITLTARGTLVRNVPPADVPIGCDVLGDVPIGLPPDAARPHSQEQLVILMRNKAAELGGNFVIVDSSDHRTGPDNEVYYFGRGRAYNCTEEQVRASEQHGPPEPENGPPPGETPPPADDERPPG